MTEQTTKRGNNRCDRAYRRSGAGYNDEDGEEERVELDPTFERQEGVAIPTPTSRVTRGSGGLNAGTDRYWSRAAWLFSILSFFCTLYLMYLCTNPRKAGPSLGILGNINTSNLLYNCETKEVWRNSKYY
jgi:hypothetical protein